MKTDFISSFQTAFKGFLVSAAVLVLAACAGSGASTRSVPDGYYRVRAGDTLSQIAKRYGQNAQTLAEWNQLRNTSQIEAGQLLRVKRHAAPLSDRAAQGRAVAPVNRLVLDWPVENGKNSIVRYFNGQTDKGIDISGVRGQPVKAAAAGQVLYVGEGVRGYGKLVLISHNDYTITAYAHNESVSVRQGQHVAAGQVIAAMGSSDTDRVKLHFEVRLNGKAVDPLPYLK